MQANSPIGQGKVGQCQEVGQERRRKYLPTARSDLQVGNDLPHTVGQEAHRATHGQLTQALLPWSRTHRMDLSCHEQVWDSSEVDNHDVER